MLWSQLTEAQAILLNGILTIVAAILGVLLGNKLFSGKVTSIETAIQHSKSLVDSHLQGLDRTLTALNEKTVQLDEVLAATSQQLAKIAGNQAEQQETATAPIAHSTESSQTEPASEVPTGDVDPYSISPHDELRQTWHSIRDRIEKIASSPNIHGRKRARYMEIDRRSFDQVINSLATDLYLRDEPLTAARAAYELWSKFKTRRREPSAEDLAEMAKLSKIFLETAIDPEKKQSRIINTDDDSYVERARD